MLGYYAVVAVAAAALLAWAHAQPHATTGGTEEAAAATVPAVAVPAHAHFPPAETATFRTVTRDTLTLIRAGQHDAAQNRIKDLETAWDSDQNTLQPMDPASWTIIDGRIDDALHAVRAKHPDQATETRTLTDLLTTLG